MPKRILIIKDAPHILKILNVIFKQEGCEVILSDDGSKASVVKKIKPEVALLDIRLKNSGQDGMSTCSRLKSDPTSQSLPVILLSAEAGFPALGMQCGADSYLHKPFVIENLLSKVHSLITLPQSHETYRS